MIQFSNKQSSIGQKLRWYALKFSQAIVKIPVLNWVLAIGWLLVGLVLLPVLLVMLLIDKTKHDDVERGNW